MTDLVIKSIQELEKWILDNECIYLYGAGKVCKQLLKKIASMGMESHIAAILVTCKEKTDCVNGVKVLQYEKNITIGSGKILRAVSGLYQNEIRDYLNECGENNSVGLSYDFEYKLDRHFAIGECRKKIVEYSKLHGGKKDKKDILFITPPFWDVYSPFSAVPCLMGKLKGEGFSCMQYDVGIHCMHYVIKYYWEERRKIYLSKEYFEKHVVKYEKNTYANWEEYVDGMFFMRKKEFDFREVKKQYMDFNAVQKRVLDSFYNDIYNSAVDYFDFDKCTSIDDEVDNYYKIGLYETLCEENVLPIFSNIPDVVGISITSLCQFVPGCILAQLFRLCNPQVKIIVGGSCADLFANSNYLHKSDVNKYFDYIIIGEGETSITRLMHYIKNGQSLEGIPNLLMVRDNDELFLAKQIVENVADLPIPDYEGVEFELYLAPETVLPYQTSRGCHYGQCAFCNHDEKYRHNYRSKDMKSVVRELLFLAKKYDVKNFQFVDEAIRPDCFKEMIDEMSKHDEFAHINWFYYSRVSRQYDRETLIKARKNGCKMVMFGIETLNQRLLKLIKKGINAETSKYCLQLFHEEGIKTYAWLMCNLPTETIEEAEKDLEDIKEIHQYIDAFCVGCFMLLPNTDMYAMPEKYGIVSMDAEDPCIFVSCNNGVEIDNDSMFDFFWNKYVCYQNQKCFTGNRYTVFFEGD